jgi:RNA polymerase-binding transcription factor DksA
LVLSIPAPRLNWKDKALLEEDLQVAQKKLHEEEAIVLAELADLGFTADGKVDIHLDEGFADAAQTTSERARVLSLAEGLQQRLDEVQAALVRIDKGTYGKCEGCGNEIAPERLEAIPAASLCIKCKSKIKR